MKWGKLISKHMKFVKWQTQCCKVLITIFQGLFMNFLLCVSDTMFSTNRIGIKVMETLQSFVVYYWINLFVVVFFSMERILYKFSATLKLNRYVSQFIKARHLPKKTLKRLNFSFNIGEMRGEQVNDIRATGR